MHTFEYIRDTALKIDEGGILQHSVLLGYTEIFRFDKDYSMAVAVIVNVLQLLEDPSTVSAVIRVCKRGRVDTHTNSGGDYQY